MKMMEKKEILGFLEDFKEAMKPLEKKYGVFIEDSGNISVDYDSFNFKIKVINGSEKEFEEKQFMQNCRYFSNVDKSMYQQKYQGNDGKFYTLIGLNPRAKKNPCILRSETGTEYSAPFSFIGLSEN